MFADTQHASWAEGSRRGWTALISFGLQAVLASLLLLLPLLRPESLPLLRRISMPLSFGRPHGEPLRAASHARASNAAVHESFTPLILTAPPRIPIGIAHTTDAEEARDIGTNGRPVSGFSGTGDPQGVLGSFPAVRPVIPAPPPAIARPVRVSHMSEGDLIRRVQPQYPPIARTAGIQGQVVLQAIISKQGTIGHLRVLTGHPLLMRAAVDAVSQWRYVLTF
ncbi:MAG: energy transducer TonB [Candidatus Sulfotelmatobacter sp.]